MFEPGKLRGSRKVTKILKILTTPQYGVCVRCVVHIPMRYIEHGERDWQSLLKRFFNITLEYVLRSSATLQLLFVNSPITAQ